MSKLYILTSDDNKPQDGPPLTNEQLSLLNDAISDSPFEVVSTIKCQQLPTTKNSDVVINYYRTFAPQLLRVLSDYPLKMLNNPTELPYDGADKGLIHKVADETGINTPKTRSNIKEEDINLTLIEELNGFPVILKGYPSGRGEDVYLCSTLDEVLANYKLCTNKGLKVLLQTYIATSHGKDTRITLVGNDIQFTLKRENTNGGFKSNLALGGIGTLVQPTEIQIELATRIADVYRFDFMGIDLLETSNGQYSLCELNSAPGWATNRDISPAIVKKAAKLLTGN